MVRGREVWGGESLEIGSGQGAVLEGWIKEVPIDWNDLTYTHNATREDMGRFPESWVGSLTCLSFKVSNHIAPECTLEFVRH